MCRGSSIAQHRGLQQPLYEDHWQLGTKCPGTVVTVKCDLDLKDEKFFYHDLCHGWSPQLGDVSDVEFTNLSSRSLCSSSSAPSVASLHSVPSNFSMRSQLGGGIRKLMGRYDDNIFLEDNEQISLQWWSWCISNHLTSIAAIENRRFNTGNWKRKSIKS